VVKNGKGGKTSVCYLSEEAVETLKEYLAARPDFELDGKRPLFFTDYGGKFNPRDIYRLGPDGSKLATGLYDGLRFWDVSTEDKMQHLSYYDAPMELIAPTKPLKSVAFSPDGSMFAAIEAKCEELPCDQYSARTWDLTTGVSATYIDGDNSVAFSPDGSMLAAGGKSVKIWNVKTGETLQEIKIIDYEVASVAFSPDGSKLATGGGESTQIWDVKSGKKLDEMKDNDYEVASVAFSPDGNKLATGGVQTIWSKSLPGAIESTVGSIRIYNV
jgi:WD40 repeat protein